MPDRTLRLILVGDGSSAVRAMDEVSVSAEESAAKVQESFRLASKTVRDEMVAAAEESRIALDSVGARGTTAFRAVGSASKDAQLALAGGINAEAGRLGGVMESSSKRAGSALEGLGSRMGGLGVPFSGAVTNMGKRIGEAETSGRRFSGVMSEVGRTSLLAGGALALGVGAASVNLADRFDASMGKVASSANISTGAAQAIGNAFLDTAGKTMVSASEMATAYSTVAGQLGAVQGRALTAAEAQNVMLSAANLADAGLGSLSATTSSLATVMMAYHLRADQAGKTTDTLYGITRVTGQGLGQVTTTLQRMHAQMGALTPSLADTGALIADLAQHGESGRAALGAVNTALTTLTKTSTAIGPTQAQLNQAFAALPPSVRPMIAAMEAGRLTSYGLTESLKTVGGSAEVEAKSFLKMYAAHVTANSALASMNLTKTQEELSALGVHINDSSGHFVGMASVIAQLSPRFRAMTSDQARLTAAQDIFGTSGRKMLDVVLAGPAAFNADAAAVSRAGTAHAAAERQMRTLHGQARVLGTELEATGIRIGRALIPTLTRVAGGVADVVGWFTKGSPAALGVAAAFGAVAAAAVGFYAFEKAKQFTSWFVGSAKSMIGGLGNLGGGFRKSAEESATSSGEIQTSQEEAATAVRNAWQTIEDAAAVLEQELGTLQEAYAATGTSATTAADEQVAAAERVQSATSTEAAGVSTSSAEEQTAYAETGASASRKAATTETAAATTETAASGAAVGVGAAAAEEETAYRGAAATAQTSAATAGVAEGEVATSAELAAVGVGTGTATQKADFTSVATTAQTSAGKVSIAEGEVSSSTELAAAGVSTATATEETDYAAAATSAQTSATEIKAAQLESGGGMGGVGGVAGGLGGGLLGKGMMAGTALMTGYQIGGIIEQKTHVGEKLGGWIGGMLNSSQNATNQNLDTLVGELTKQAWSEPKVLEHVLAGLRAAGTSGRQGVATANLEKSIQKRLRAILPHAQTGAVVDGETLMWVGEKGREFVIPEADLGGAGGRGGSVTAGTTRRAGGGGGGGDGPNRDILLTHGAHFAALEHQGQTAAPHLAGIHDATVGSLASLRRKEASDKAQYEQLKALLATLPRRTYEHAHVQAAEKAAHADYMAIAAEVRNTRHELTAEKHAQRDRAANAAMASAQGMLGHIDTSTSGTLAQLKAREVAARAEYERYRHAASLAPAGSPERAAAKAAEDQWKALYHELRDAARADRANETAYKRGLRAEESHARAEYKASEHAYLFTGSATAGREAAHWKSVEDALKAELHAMAGTTAAGVITPAMRRAMAALPAGAGGVATAGGGGGAVTAAIATGTSTMATGLARLAAQLDQIGAELRRGGSGDIIIHAHIDLNGRQVGEALFPHIHKAGLIHGRRVINVWGGPGQGR